MDYKEKYEQGLECIQEILSSGQEKIKITLLKERLLPFFPELESEDDKIRKGLIKALSSVGKRNWGGIDVFKSIAWLEKQKEIDKEIVFRPLAGTDIIAAAKQALEKIEIGKEVVLAFNGAYIHVNGKTVAEICNEYFAWTENRVKHLENYDEAEKEKADFVGDGFIECRADFLDFKEGNSYWLEYVGDDKYNVRSDNLLGKTYHITPCQLYTIFKKQTWLEKQGKKKTTNKVEPKFKVDDWIANDYCTGKVIALTDDAYLLDSGQGIPFSCEHNVHLWTIADAEADSNIDVLLNALTTVSEYVNELKHGLKHEKEDLSKLP